MSPTNGFGGKQAFQSLHEIRLVKSLLTPKALNRCTSSGPAENRPSCNYFNLVFQKLGNRHLPRFRVGECFSPSEFVGPAPRERLKNTLALGTGSQKPIPKCVGKKSPTRKTSGARYLVTVGEPVTRNI